MKKIISLFVVLCFLSNTLTMTVWAYESPVSLPEYNPLAESNIEDLLELSREMASTYVDLSSEELKDEILGLIDHSLGLIDQNEYISDEVKQFFVVTLNNTSERILSPNPLDDMLPIFRDVIFGDIILRLITITIFLRTYDVTVSTCAAFVLVQQLAFLMVESYFFICFSSFDDCPGLSPNSDLSLGASFAVLLFTVYTTPEICFIEGGDKTFLWVLPLAFILSSLSIIYNSPPIILWFLSYCMPEIPIIEEQE